MWVRIMDEQKPSPEPGQPEPSGSVLLARTLFFLIILPAIVIYLVKLFTG